MDIHSPYSFDENQRELMKRVHLWQGQMTGYTLTCPRTGHHRPFNHKRWRYQWGNGHVEGKGSQLFWDYHGLRTRACFPFSQRQGNKTFVMGECSPWTHVKHLPHNYDVLKRLVENATPKAYGSIHIIPCYSLKKNKFHQANVDAFDEAMVFVTKKLENAKKHQAFWINKGLAIKNEAEIYERETGKELQLMERSSFLVHTFTHRIG